MKKDYEAHPLAGLFPMMTTEDFGKLKSDIDKNGQLVPVTLDKDGILLLDGRNRLRACRELGIEPRVDRTDRDAESFIWSANILRRHLTDHQRAMIAAKWADALREDAKKRATANLKKGDQKPEMVISPRRGKTRNAIAQQAQVSEHVARQAEEVRKKAPHLAPEVESGELKLRDAVKSITPSPRYKAFDETAALRIIKDRTIHAIGAYWDHEDRTPVATLLRQIASDIEYEDLERPTLTSVEQLEAHV